MIGPKNRKALENRFSAEGYLILRMRYKLEYLRLRLEELAPK